MMTERRYRKGDRVRFRFGVKDVEGTVIEERGPIGIGGRRLYGIQFHLGSDPEGEMYVELPAVDMKPVEPASHR